MLAIEKRNTNLGVCGGIVLFLGGHFVMDAAGRMGAVAVLGLVAVVAGYGLFLWGCVSYARGKGHNGAWGLLGFLSIPGLIVLFFFPDRHKVPTPGSAAERPVGQALPITPNMPEVDLVPDVESSFKTRSRSPSETGSSMRDKDVPDAFATFAGIAKYNRFLAALRGACRQEGRLLSWQEKLWSEFTDHSNLSLSADLNTLSRLLAGQRRRFYVANAAEAKARELFPIDHLALVLELLDSVGPTFGDEPIAERVQLAAVKRSGGRVEKIREDVDILRSGYWDQGNLAEFLKAEKA